MGKNMFCDLCRANVAIEEALKPVSIGENVIAEVCLTCGSQLEQSLKKQISDNAAALVAAQKAAASTAPPPAASTAPPKQPEQKPADKPAGVGGV